MVILCLILWKKKSAWVFLTHNIYGRAVKIRKSFVAVHSSIISSFHSHRWWPCCNPTYAPNTHRRRQRDALVGSRDPVYNFLCCWAIAVGNKWRRNDVIVEEVINIDQHSRSQTTMESVRSVSKLSTESVGSRREQVANSVHTADADATQLDSWVASVCIEHKRTDSAMQPIGNTPTDYWICFVLRKVRKPYSLPTCQDKVPRWTSQAVCRW